MSEELQVNPPHNIQLDELGPEINVDVKTYKTGGQWRHNEEVLKSL